MTVRLRLPLCAFMRLLCRAHLSCRRRLLALRVPCRLRPLAVRRLRESMSRLLQLPLPLRGIYCRPLCNLACRVGLAYMMLPQPMPARLCMVRRNCQAPAA